MSRITVLCSLFLSLPCWLFAVEKPADIDEYSTHQQTRVIEISQGQDDKLEVNAFCLNQQGQILAACGSGPGEIRVLDTNGKLLRSWEIDVKPEAINVTDDDTVLVGGNGKLFQFSPEGTLLKSADAPHAESLRENTEALREEAIAYLDRYKNRNSTSSLQARIVMYERIIAQLEKKAETDELSNQEQSILTMLPKTLETWKEQLVETKKAEADQGEEKEVGHSEQAIQEQVDRMMDSKMRIASISTDGESIYVATRALTGYGFAVWKTNQSFAEGKEIVSGLSGCCGQMDVQACKNGLFVAENSRKRVVCYNKNGDELRKWGESDRTGVDGFTSCCNPMNVCFNKNGDVFTAESNSGRIKRFSATGEFLNFVGDVKLVPGCKNVSIAVTPDHDQVFMLDITRNHIVVLEKKAEAPKSIKPEKDEATASTGEE